MEKPQFVIGIGSQRAGSTLLHRILDECTDIFMHPVKELHYFDTLYNVRHQDVLTKYSKRQVDRELEKIISSKEHRYLTNKKYKCFLRANKLLANKGIKDIDYLDLYRPCLMGNKIIGEITPEYMILPEKGVKYMSEVLGANTPIILITRNPIDRFVSAFKLLKAYGNEKVDMSNFEGELIDVFDSMPSWIEQQKQLNNYKLAFDNFSKYFNNVLLLSYDELVNESERARTKLEDALGIKLDSEKYNLILNKKVNQIGETKKLSEKTIAFLQSKL